MIPGSEGNQVRVVCWCRDGNRTSTAYVRMTQLVGKNLQFVGRETIVIPEDMVMRRSACSLRADHTDVRISETALLTCHLCRRTAVQPPASSEITREQFYILQQIFPLKMQITSLLAPHTTNPFAFSDRTAFSRISSLLLRLNDLTEMHFHLVKLRSDKKPSYKVVLGKTLIAYSKLVPLLHTLFQPISNVDFQYCC